MSIDSQNNPAAAAEFKNLVDLMAIISEGSARMAELENSLQQDYLDLVDARRKDYASLQFTMGQAESAIEVLARTNPSWFEKAKTVKTPYGSVSLRTSKKLDVKNEEVSIVLLEQLGQDGLPFIRTQKALNLEALEKLDDSELERLRIRRVTTERLNIKPAKVDLGKAVKQTSKEDAEA